MIVTFWSERLDNQLLSHWMQIFWLVMRAMTTSQRGNGTGSDSCAMGQRVTGVGLGGLLWKASGKR